jgi:OmpA-OmpF porin, OOP family
MRCNPWRWMWGLIPIAMLTWFANQWERPGIEDDLKFRAEEALKRDGLDWAKIDFEGRDAILTGRATDEAEPKQAMDVLRRTFGVRISKSRTDLVERVETYNWAAAFDAGKVTLSGYVPNETTRRNILGLAKASFPKATITDEMTVARGAPPNDVFTSGVGFGLKQLASLKTGSVSLRNTDLSIAGQAYDSPSYKLVKAAVPGKLPKGWSLGKEAVTPPAINPFTWSAKYAANQLVLSGYAPSEAAKEAVYQHAKKTFAKIAVVDRLDVAGGAPSNWQDAAVRSLDQLHQLKDGSAEMRNSELMLSGNAETETIAAAARQGIQGMSSKGFKVSDAIKAPKPQVVTPNPYVTAAASGNSRVTLTGFVPSEAGRASVLAGVRARFPNRAIDDKLQVAPGAPLGWEQCVLAGLSGLGRLDQGDATMTASKLVLSGATSDQATATSLPTDLRSAATNVCDTDTRIELTRQLTPVFRWYATKNTNGTIVLEGESPDANSQAELVRQAEQIFPGTQIDDRMTVVSKRSDTWPKVTAQALRVLSNLKSGEANMFGDDVVVRGLASSEDVAASTRLKLRDLPTGFIGRDEIRVDTAELEDARRRAELEAKRKAEEDARKAEEDRRKADEARRKAEEDAIRREKEAAAEACEQLLSDAANLGTIQFDRASDRLSRSSRKTIAKLAEIANECPKTKIEISGHTDSEGIPERNQPLSERRAAAVAAALIEQGVSEARLTAEGYGADRPIADNDSAQGRAKNRRIEFSVVPE